MGVDGSQRARRGLSGVRQSTWVAGVDRLLAGLVMADEPPARLDTVVPVEHLDAGDADLIGGLAEFVSRMRMHLLEFAQPCGMAQWRTRILDAIADLTDPDVAEQWQVNHIAQELDRLSAGAGTGSTALSAADISAMLRRLLRPSLGRADFGTGSLVMCGLGDIQALGHRVIVLLGIDDEHFPRGSPMITTTSWRAPRFHRDVSMPTPGHASNSSTRFCPPASSSSSSGGELTSSPVSGSPSPWCLPT